MVFTLGAFQMSREDKKQPKLQAQLFPLLHPTDIKLFNSVQTASSSLGLSCCHSFQFDLFILSLFFLFYQSLSAAVSSSSSMCPYYTGGGAIDMMTARGLDC